MRTQSTAANRLRSWERQFPIHSLARYWKVRRRAAARGIVPQHVRAAGDYLMVVWSREQRRPARRVRITDEQAYGEFCEMSDGERFGA